MKYAVLYINMSDSRCGACNKNASPYEEAHANEAMRGPGCGATFTHVSSDYVGFEDRVREMRPDLAFVSPCFHPHA